LLFRHVISKCLIKNKSNFEKQLNLKLTESS
jgi:hypothetical protein